MKDQNSVVQHMLKTLQTKQEKGVSSILQGVVPESSISLHLKLHISIDSIAINGFVRKPWLQGLASGLLWVPYPQKQSWVFTALYFSVIASSSSWEDVGWPGSTDSLIKRVSCRQKFYDFLHMLQLKRVGK